MPDDRRYYGLDALRGGMMLMGIVLHAATFYIGAPPPNFPILTDRNTSIVMDGIVDLVHSFRMPTFFVLAGFFAALLVEKRGLAGAYRNRGARVAGPLVAAIFTVLPLTLLLMLDFLVALRFGKFELLPDRSDLRQIARESTARGAPAGFPIMHLWFLLYLCYFYLLIPFCRLLVRWSSPIEARVGRFLASPLSLPVFAAWTAMTLWPYQGALVFGDFIMLGFSPPAALYYGTFFVIGYIYHHYRVSTAVLVGYVPWCAALSSVLFPLSIYASQLEFAHSSAEAGFHLFAVVVHGLCTWSLIWLLVGLALRYWDRPTPWALYASQSAYWVYLLHLPIVALVAWPLVFVDAPAILKWLIVSGITTVACFTTYHYWVQDTWLGAFLNGKRFQLDWPWRTNPAPAGVLQGED